MKFNGYEAHVLISSTYLNKIKSDQHLKIEETKAVHGSQWKIIIYLKVHSDNFALTLPDLSCVASMVGRLVFFPEG